MSPEIQTVIALLVVAGAVVWLMRRALQKGRSGCGGEGCGAVSPEAKALLKKLKRH